MEAATRSALEPLSDLPVEKPLDAGATPSGAEGARPPATRDDLINPDDLLSGRLEPALPAAPAAVTPEAAATAPESELQDLALLALDELPPLEALTPAAPPQPGPAATDDAPATPPGKVTGNNTDHTKLRGALRLASTPRSRAPTQPPRASSGSLGSASPPARDQQPKAAAPVRKTERVPVGGTPRSPGTPAVSSAPQAPLVSPSRALAPAVAPPAPATPAAPAGAAANAAGSSSSAQSSAPAGAPMDRDFIVRNQIVERYLSGRLPLKGAGDFERFCREQPQYLDEIGLSDRVNAGLRLLEAGGKPEPWQEAPRPFWQKPQVPLALAALVAALGIALALVVGQSAGRARQLERLKTLAAERPLDPATSTREIRLLPSREGASNNPALVIGGGPAQLIDLKVDESRSAYKVFRVTIDRIDQGRVAVLGNLLKDSNGHLRIALNSSALGPGNYQFTIEGLNWRGEAEPDSWITLGVQH